MARVIKHFEGSGTAAPYTVPAGKVAQIQGFITFVSTTATSDLREGSFRFGGTEMFFIATQTAGFHVILSSDSTQIQPVGLIQSANRFVDVRAGSITKTGAGNQGPLIAFDSPIIYDLTSTSTNPGVPGTQVPAPRIYIGAGGSLSFTQGASSYIGFNIVAIEEDV